MTHVASLYCQQIILPGITYVEKTPTMEHDQFYSNIFHHPFYNIQMYNIYIYILMTIQFPLVYDNDLKYDFFIFHLPGKQDHLAVASISNLVTSMEYALRKLIYLS